MQQSAKGHFLWTVNAENQAEYRPVVIGDWYGTDVFVTEGLRAGDRVVVDGGLALRAGAPVAAKPFGGK